MAWGWRDRTEPLGDPPWGLLAAHSFPSHPSPGPSACDRWGAVLACPVYPTLLSQLETVAVCKHKRRLRKLSPRGFQFESLSLLSNVCLPDVPPTRLGQSSAGCIPSGVGGERDPPRLQRGARAELPRSGEARGAGNKQPLGDVGGPGPRSRVSEVSAPRRDGDAGRPRASFLLPTWAGCGDPGLETESYFLPITLHEQLREDRLQLRCAFPTEAS